MSITNPNSNLILGYHGCSKETAEGLLAGDAFQHSTNEYDWLGWGAYFWENNPRRAWQFSQQKVMWKDYEEPAIVGVIISLEDCLDLTTARSIEAVRDTYEAVKDLFKSIGEPLPKNQNPHHINSGDILFRSLDCYVINFLCCLHDQEPLYFDQKFTGKTLDIGKGAGSVKTVRGVFWEGPPIYEGSGFREKTHTQVAVRDLSCIRGVFRVPSEEYR